MMSARITQVQKTVNTSNMPDDLDAPTARPDYDSVFKKWRHLEDAVRHAPWSETPPDMLRDYLAATAGILEKSYGSNAATKAAQMIATELATGVPDDVFSGKVTVKGAWPEAGAESILSFSFKNDGQEDKNVPGVEFTLQSEAPMSDNDVFEALQDDTKARTRMIMDPFVSLPDEHLSSLLRAWEDVFKNSSLSKDDINKKSLYCAMSHLLLWNEAEQRNAAETRIGLSGLSYRDQPLAPGKTAVVEIATTMLDRVLSPPQSDDVSHGDQNENENDAPLHTYTVSFKPS